MTRKSILIVDDDPVTITNLRGALRKIYDVLATTSSQEVVEIAEKQKPDIILLDIGMKPIDGYAVLTLLKKNPQTVNIPVIFLTGLTETTHELKGLELGAVDYITKPPRAEILIQRIKNHLELKSYHDDLQAQVDLKTKDILELNKNLEIEKENALEANSAKDRFLAMVSHEMLTTMNSIVGFTARVLNTQLSEKQRAYLGYCRDSSAKLERIISDILDVSKLKYSCFDIQSQPFELSTILKTLKNNFRKQCADKGLALNINIDENVPDKHRGDKLRLEQILSNLLSNAIKFTSGGKINVNISCKKKSATSTFISFRVKDTGQGIAREYHQKIFDCFQRFISQDSTAPKGVGLGLTIAKRLVELMGGDLQVESEINQGATFYFTLELLTIQEDAKIIEPLKKEINHYGHNLFPHLNVLIVDDDEPSQILLQETLEEYGMITDAVKSGEQALKKIKRNPFDVILMDLELEGKSGLEITREIRKTVGIAHVIIIAQTAQLMSINETQCLEAGMNDYITKPIDINVLFEKICKWLPEEKINTLARFEKPLDPMPIDYSIMNQLSQLKGIDSLAAAHCPGFNLNIFLNSLKRFFSFHTSTLDEIKEAIKQSNFKNTRDLAHKLKGSSAYIKAKKIQFLSEKLEILSEYKIKDPDPLISELEDELNRVLNSVEALLNTISNPSISNQDNQTKPANFNISSQLQKAKELLLVGDSAYQEILEEIIPYLKEVFPAERIFILKEHMQNYDDKECLKTLIDIDKCLKISKKWSQA